MSGFPGIIADNLVNSTDNIQTITYRFEVSASGFTSTAIQTAVVTVNPAPKMTITNTNLVINSGGMTDILLNTPTENGQVRLKSVVKSDPGLTGNTTVGASFPDGTRIEDVLFNSTNGSQSITYEFEVSANGCLDPVTILATVNVVPVATMTITNNVPIICSSENADITLSSTTVGAIIELIAVNTTPNAGSVSGITPVNTTWNVFPTSILDNLQNNSNSTQKVEYIFQVSVGGNINPIVQIVTVDVKPTPNIAAFGSGICSGDVTNIDIWNPNGVNFTVFNWVTLSTGVVTGAGSGTGNKIAQQLFNVSPSLDAVVYRIYSSAQSCIGDSIEINQFVNPRNIANAGTDTVVCQGTPSIVVETASIGGSATNVDWTVLSGGGSLLNANSLVPTYVPNPANEIGTVYLQMTASDTSVCPAVSDITAIIINAIPTVEAGPDQTICESDVALLSDAVIGGSTNAITWTDSTGLGTFLPNANTLNAFFVPAASQVGSKVKLYITTNDPAGPCGWVIDSLSITINGAPVVNAGSNQTICEADSAYLSDASIGGTASSVIWSGGSGSFYPNNTTLNAYYRPAISEIGSSVTLTVTSNDPDGAGPCGTAQDQVVITINKAPEVDAGLDRIICETSNVTLNGSIGGAATNATWSTAGDGSFSFVGDLNSKYFPGPNDILNSGVTLTLTTNDPAGPCSFVSDVVFIQIDQAPTTNAGLYAPICIGDTVD
ncbi:MAG: PKD-like domain-containing protein [Cyclobacteriaceae bacterium]|nr:PKD-like domain-containing protein [Cyclobacteriaceae bacterium]